MNEVEPVYIVENKQMKHDLNEIARILRVG